VLIPRENAAELPAEVPGVEVIPISRVDEALGLVFVGEPGRNIRANTAIGQNSTTELLAAMAPSARMPGA
jgi:predicted ATP-dependent protease